MSMPEHRDNHNMRGFVKMSQRRHIIMSSLTDVDPGEDAAGQGVAGVVGGNGDVDPLAAVVHRVLQTLAQRQREDPGTGRGHGHCLRVPGHGGGQGARPGATVHMRDLRPSPREE